jgi:hypothetical protein
MAADVPALEHAAVQRDRLDPPPDQPVLLGPGGLLVEHPVHQPAPDQPGERAAQRVVVGRPRQADVREPLGAVHQQRLYPAVALLLMLAQHEAREQLRLGEPVVAAERAGVGREQRQRQLVRLAQDRTWRLAGFHPA